MQSHLPLYINYFGPVLTSTDNPFSSLTLINGTISTISVTKFSGMCLLQRFHLYDTVITSLAQFQQYLLQSLVVRVYSSDFTCMTL